MLVMSVNCNLYTEHICEENVNHFIVNWIVGPSQVDFYEDGLLEWEISGEGGIFSELDKKLKWRAATFNNHREEGITRSLIQVAISINWKIDSSLQKEIQQ